MHQVSQDVSFLLLKQLVHFYNYFRFISGCFSFLCAVLRLFCLHAFLVIILHCLFLFIILSDSLLLMQQASSVNSHFSECPSSISVFFLIRCLWISSGNGLATSLFLESLTALSRLSYFTIQDTPLVCCPK